MPCGTPLAADPKREVVGHPAPGLRPLVGLHCLRAGGAGEHQDGSDRLLWEKGRTRRPLYGKEHPWTRTP